jgi:purine-nucleoside phosphorylase
MNPVDPRPAVLAARAFAERAGVRPRVGLVLGSGLGPLADALEIKASHPTIDLPGFPASTAPGHSGRLLFGRLAGVDVAAFQGRLHVYEGHPLAVAALTARVLCGLGVDLLVLTNAAGGLRPDWKPGDVMLMSDHLNLFGGSPLEGPNEDAWGVRFPDLTRLYPAELRAVVRARAAGSNLTLREGVYAGWRGPQYETPAEVRMLGRLGADTVGMSTVPEAIVAGHMRTPVLGLSVVTNWAAGVTGDPITADEVLEVGRRVAAGLSALVRAALPELVETAVALRSRGPAI